MGLTIGQWKLILAHKKEQKSTRSWVAELSGGKLPHNTIIEGCCYRGNIMRAKSYIVQSTVGMKMKIVTFFDNSQFSTVIAKIPYLDQIVGEPEC